VLQHPDAEWLILEVRSFQLETVQRFSPDISILLNILPNHLDRHGSMELYQRMKYRIFGTAERPSSAAILPAHLPLPKNFPGQILRFGNKEGSTYTFRNGSVFRNGDAVADLTDTAFDSPVLGPCTAAALAAALDALKLPPNLLESAARQFQPLPHRFERLGTINGVTYINDSKATNLAALAAAVKAAGSGVHLIAGGRSKESDYTFIKEILAERVGCIYLVGEVSQELNQAWGEVCTCRMCGTLERAFSAAEEAAKPGEVVLLSPGCASFDQFQNFEQRGERFRSLFRTAQRDARGDHF
jgi:UDP-N-acetylmuramoylalanine--D-glutamate ligase